MATRRPRRAPSRSRGRRARRGRRAPRSPVAGFWTPSPWSTAMRCGSSPANFDLLEAHGEGDFSKNGKINKRTLLDAAANKALPDGLRTACRFFLDHETAAQHARHRGQGRAGGWHHQHEGRAGRAGEGEPRHRRSSACAGRPAPTPSRSSSVGAGHQHASSSSGHQHAVHLAGHVHVQQQRRELSQPGGREGVRDIINNPNMSIEEKLQAILMALTEDADDEMLDVMNDMAAARTSRPGSPTRRRTRRPSREAKLQQSEKLNLRLQKLMEKRKADVRPDEQHVLEVQRDGEDGHPATWRSA